MFTQRFPRSAVLAAALVALMSAALLAPTSAHAAPKRIVCGESGCKQSCTQQLPDGATVYYDDGTTITIQDKDGTVSKFRCENGQWVQTGRTLPPRVLGTVNLRGSIAGVQGEVDVTTCAAFDGDECVETTTTTYQVGPAVFSAGD